MCVWCFKKLILKWKDDYIKVFIYEIEDFIGSQCQFSHRSFRNAFLNILIAYLCFISYSLIKRDVITFMCNQTKEFHLVEDNMGGKSRKTDAYNLNRDVL